MILITGGAGFIGSNFIHAWVAGSDESVINFDKLTYAANLNNLQALRGDSRYVFMQGDICDKVQVKKAFAEYKPRAVLHFAAESHVDRSIANPAPFIATNIHGTFTLLEEARHYWSVLPEREREAFRFLHVSTDEVYGSLGPCDAAFSETTAYAPNSPYSASKAASDHMVRAYHHTYGLPTLTINCSNNYGPYQFPEKFIPRMIVTALEGKALPVYGDGQNIRDWLYVEDHCTAIRRVLEEGHPGATYNIGGCSERTNIEVVHAVCNILDMLAPKSTKYSEQISFVQDRAGHDRRYAVNVQKIGSELGWEPDFTFDSGIRKTVQWYLDNRRWLEEIQSGVYRGGRQQSVSTEDVALTRNHDAA